MSEGPNLVAAFPPDGIDGYKRVFSQEKDGFAEAKLQKDGVDVATLSIASAEDAAKAQLEDAKERFGDWPMIVGSDRTIVLVKHRYQVTVASRTLDRDARGRILDRFDLERLAGGR